jgi:hypothetical protein
MAVIGSEEVEAARPNLGIDAADIVRAFQHLAQHRICDRVARTVRHGRDERGDGRQRRGLALAPADLAAGGDADDAGVLAAVTDVLDLGHRQVEDVDLLDPPSGHGLLRRQAAWRTATGGFKGC